MIFTQEQINEIKQRLALSGSKDLQFPLAELPLTGEEVIAIVQNGENKRVSIEEFYEEFSQYIDGSERVDFFNVSRYAQRIADADNSIALTLAEAVELCPEDVKRGGQVITFVGNEGNWAIWQYKGTTPENWNDTETSWVNLDYNPNLGIIFTASDTSVPFGESKNIYLHFETSDGGKASVVQLFINNELFKTYKDVATLDINKEVSEESLFTLKVSQYGYEYEESHQVLISYPAWIGAGESYDEVIKDANKFEAIDSIDGIYTTTFDKSANLIAVVPKSFIIGPITMSGFEVPMEPASYQKIEGVDYAIYMSSNKYIAGTHTFTVGTYKGSEKDLITSVQQDVGGLQTLMGEQEALNQEQSKNIENIQENVEALKNEGLNGPDDEDITLVDRKYKFADKVYSELDFSGMGRVYLRKNIQDITETEGNVTTITKKNVLTQSMVNKHNTIYIIQYDYDLLGAAITIPEGCVLDFQGGSLNNGELIGNGTQTMRNSLLQRVEVKNILRKEFDISNYRRHNEGYSDTLQRIIDNAKSNEFIDIYFSEGTFEFENPVFINPNSYTSLYYSLHGKGYSTRIQYNGEGALVNVNAGGGVGLKFEMLWCGGNYKNQLIASLMSDGAASYFHFLELHDCFITSFDQAVSILRGYSVIVDRCQFRSNNIALKLNCANHNVITNSNFPYGNKTCIEYDNTEVPDSQESSTISTLIQGCRFEGMEIGILFKSIWCTTVLGCYFEPKDGGKTVIVNNGDNRISSLLFMSNYGKYDKYIELNGTLHKLSFIQNRMSIKFMEGCDIKSVYIHNHDYTNFTITGVTDDIAKNIYDDAIEYNKYAPQNIIRPNLLSPSECYNGETQFDENNWSYVIASNIPCTAYFNLYSININGGNQYTRSFQIINAETSEVIYEYGGIDPQFSTLHNPIVSIKNVNRVNLVIKCLTQTSLSQKFPYSVTFSRRLYHTY